MTKKTQKRKNDTKNMSFRIVGMFGDQWRVKIA